MEDNKDLEVVTDEKVEEVVETTEEVKEEVVEATEEVKEETVEATDEAKEEVVETTEEVVEAEPVVEEPTAESAEDATEETTEETTEEIEDGDETSSDDEEKPVKKAKKKLDKTNVIVIVICAVVVVACLAFLGFKLGWFNFLNTGKITLPDYNSIEVAKQQVETSDELVDEYINELLSMAATTKQVKEGVVEDGDTVNIDYVGKIAETGVAFDGGTASGYDLVIGSGSFIDGFEDQLIGKAIGSKTTVNVTFPEEYPNNPDLAGVPAIFEVTLNYKSVTVNPELTDEWVKENGSHYIPGEFKTVDEFKKGMKDYVYKIQLHTAIFEDIYSKQVIESYNEKDKKELKEYLMTKFAEQAEYYQYDIEELAQMYGAESADAYVEAEAKNYLDMMMPINKIFKDLHLKVTDEIVDEYLQRYIYQQGLAGQYTVEQVKEQQGEYWVKLYTELEVKYDIAMSALEDKVKFIDAADLETPTEAATN